MAPDLGYEFDLETRIPVRAVIIVLYHIARAGCILIPNMTRGDKLWKTYIPGAEG